MWAFIGSASAVLTLFGLINLIKPLQSLKIKNRRQAFVVFAVSFLVFSVSTVNSSNTTITTSTTPNTSTVQKAEPAKPVEKPKPKLELLEAHSESAGYGRYVVGTIKNNTNHQYSYVQIEINLYDNSGAQVGSTLANTNNLEPGGKWRFKAVILEDSAARFKIKDITGW